MLLLTEYDLVNDQNDQKIRLFFLISYGISTAQEIGKSTNNNCEYVS